MAPVSVLRHTLWNAAVLAFGVLPTATILLTVNSVLTQYFYYMYLSYLYVTFPVCVVDVLLCSL